MRQLRLVEQQVQLDNYEALYLDLPLSVPVIKKMGGLVLKDPPESGWELPVEPCWGIGWPV